MELSEEEKKAIEQLKYELEIPNSIPLYWAIDIVLKLVDKLKNNLYEEQEQNEYLKDKVEKHQKEIEALKKITNTYNSYGGNLMNDTRIIICDSRYFLNGTFVNKFVSKDKIREKIKNIEDIYKKEMKPYQTEYGLNISLLSKKEKEELINKRNGLLTQKITLEQLLEEN